MKKDFKNEIRSLTIDQLQDRLLELNKEKMKVEMRGHGFTGDMGIPMTKGRLANMPDQEPTALKPIKTKIAFIKQVISMKEREVR